MSSKKLFWENVLPRSTVYVSWDSYNRTHTHTQTQTQFLTRNIPPNLGEVCKNDDFIYRHRSHTDETNCRIAHILGILLMTSY